MSDASETNAEKFTRLRDKRLPKVLDAMRILGNITNPRDYDYTEEQAREIVAQVQAGIDDIARGFGLPAGTPVSLTEISKSADQTAESGEDDIVVDDDDAPVGVEPKIRETDGRRLRVKPGEWTDLELHRAGPNLGLAMEAVMDGDRETALDLLKKVMAA